MEYFDSIQAIANLKPRRFLVRTSIVGYQLNVESGVSSWVPLEVSPGQVLTTGIVYMDQKKSKSNVKNFFKKIIKPSKHSQKDQELKYLQCFDSSVREVMIPMIMTGVFSPVGDLTNNDYDSVYELQDLVASFSLPVRAQLIHADPDSGALPSGQIMIEGVREEVTIIAGVYPVHQDSELVEIPITAKLYFRKDASKGHAKHKKEQIVLDADERIYENSAPSELEVELPIRIKSSKKSKGPGLLEKLSLRSKGKKERASLKQLQEEGVFSSRLTKSDFNLEVYMQDDDVDADGIKISHEDVESKKPDYTDDSDPVYRPSQQPTQEDAVYQGRNLPPIPKSPEEREPLYEELPVAPRPPSEEVSPKYNTHHNHDDDYMSPAQVRREKERSHGKPPIAPRNPNKTRENGYRTYRDDPLDFDKLFPFTEDGRVTQLNKPEVEYGESNPYQTTVNAQTEASAYNRDLRMRAHDHKMDNDPFNSLTRMRSRSHRNLLMDANATVRSHNMRHVNHVMNVFNFDDMTSGTQPPNPGLSQDPVPVREFGHRLSLFEPVQSDRRSLYAMSEPATRRYQRSMSSSGINEIMSLSRQEDSVLSGDYGYHGDSEYSYAEYGEDQDDGWRPPTDLSNLSVQDVSRSLRYIGMKDRVVKRLANEQIDGQLLCSLDKALLREGFPELNALDVKKIVDFINGWRPKK